MSVPDLAESPPTATIPTTFAGASDGERLATRPFIDLIVAQLWFAFAYATFLLLPKLLAADYHADAGQVGFVMAAFGVMSLGASPAIGPIIRRLGSRGTMVAANLVLAVSALGFLAMSGPGLFPAFLRGLQGVAWALAFGAGMTLCAAITPPERLGQALGIFGAASLGMSAVAPVLAEPIAARWGARPTFAIAALAAAIGAYRCARLVDDDDAPGQRQCPAAAPRRPLRGRVGAHAGLRRAGHDLAGGRRAVHVRRAVRAGARGGGRARVLRRLHDRRARLALRHRPRHRRWWPRAARRPAPGSSTRSPWARWRCWDRGTCVLVGAVFGVAHGIIYPALMALVLTDVAAIDRPRLLGWANGAMNLGIVALAPLGTFIQRAGYPRTFATVGATTGLVSLVLLAPAGRWLRRAFGWR